VRDVDQATEESAKEKVQRFRKDHPQAKEVPAPGSKK
jgi:hypothetical protein